MHLVFDVLRYEIRCFDELRAATYIVRRTAL
jgi:hypothetical protein